MGLPGTRERWLGRVARRQRFVCLLLLLPASVLAAAEDEQHIETIEVVARTPLGTARGAGSGMGIRRVDGDALREQRALDLTQFLNRNINGVFVNEAQSNPLQPDVRYRGFVGSPLLGLPQGIAVYHNGVRINEPFGDTVNWAVIPSSAIDHALVIPGSDPLFGLNALGGVIAVSSKTGFSSPGTRAQLFAGSESRVGLQGETGGTLGDNVGYFITAAHLEEDGWRDFSATDADQFEAALSWRFARTSVDVYLTRVDTDLIGNGPAPVQLLDTDRDAVFTHPDQTRNEATLLNVVFDREVSSSVAVSGNGYFRRSDIATLNGDDSDYEACEETPGFLCLEDDGEETLALDLNFNPVPLDERLEGATLNRSDTDQDIAGLSLQLDWHGSILGRGNVFVAGVTYDSADVRFTASTELGSLDDTRGAVPGGVRVADGETRLDMETRHAAAFFSNALQVTDRLRLSLAGRYNTSEVKLRDRLGTALDGDHEFRRFNPAVELSFAPGAETLLYARYSESSRIPSPVELTCADEDDPCRLPNAFLADPPLEQVVARTVEVGGSLQRGRMTLTGTLFRTDTDDEIIFISAGALTNQGYFDNVGRTRRAGVELEVSGELAERLRWFANYTFLDATFRSEFAVASPNHPYAVDGEILVAKGDELPLVPRHLLKSGLELRLTDRWSLGADVQVSSGVYLRGDEANLDGRIDGHVVANLRGNLALTEHLALWASATNLFAENYETFGLYGAADEVLGEAFDNPRFFSPGAPRGLWLGIDLAF